MEVASDALARPVDQDAEFSEFVGTHRARAVSIAFRLMGGDLDAAEDVAQDAFIRAYRSIGRFRGESELSTWFFRILVRQAHNARRWRRVRDRFAAIFGTEQDGVVAGPVGDPAIRRRVAVAIGALPRGQREAFVLVQLEGFAVTEAAELLGRAPGTVKSHLFRASRALRAALSDIADEEEKR